MNITARKYVPGLVFLILISLIVGCTAAAPPPTAQPPTAVATAQVAISPVATAVATEKPTAVPTATPNAPTVTPTAVTPTATTSPSPVSTSSPSPTGTATATAEAISTAEGTATAEATAAPFPTSAPSTAVSAAIPLSTLPDYAGQEVTVNGRVVATSNFANGFKFTLDDGSGRAVLLLWHNVYDDTWDAPQLNVGAAVQATGSVSLYEGEWQIEPDFGGDVQVTTPGGSYAPPQAIGELANHVGELAQISGTILRLEANSSSVKIFVGDDTGEIVVFVWRTLLDRIPNNVALGEVGTKVRVNGRVENYRSNLELVPALPYDVEVIQ
ncbi:MAG: hypothetical protein H6659_05320 [Ardenticatenaceae bacterium]|nr:hypothetical protein [Ardenticatenaceae bacterium]